MTKTTQLFYRETLFDANHDLMIGYLVGEGTPDEMAREMVGNAWNAWTARLRADHPELTAGRAGRILNEAIGFLYLAGRTQDTHGPSREVDLGWHVMLTDTRVYAALSHVLAGRLIHHDASDLLGTTGGEAKCDHTCGSECTGGGRVRERVPLRETVAALSKLGPVDADLWPATAVLEPA